MHESSTDGGRKLIPQAIAPLTNCTKSQKKRCFSAFLYILCTNFLFLEAPGKTTQSHNKKEGAAVSASPHNEILIKSTYDNEQIVCHKCSCDALDNFSSDNSELTLCVMN